MDSVQACEAWYIGSIPIERTTFPGYCGLLKKVFSPLALMVGAAVLLSAQPAATLDQLRAHQLKERQELRTDQTRRFDQLRRNTTEDQELFKHRRKERKRDFDAALKVEQSAFDASLQGLSKDERQRKKTEFKAQRKQKQAEFKRSLAQEGERFYYDLQAQWDFLKGVQGKEVLQLDEKQRGEREHE